MENHQLINATSLCVEFYTPPVIVEAARKLMGGIDLDPASSARANESVKAGLYYDEKLDGLKQPWFGRVWMNHPFSKSERACKPGCTKKVCNTRGHIDHDKPGNKEWINKLVSEYKTGRVTEACCITFAATSEAWFRPLFGYPKCWLYPRTNYVLPDGTTKKGITKGSVITYFGSNISQFHLVFKFLGAVTIPL